MSDITHTPEEAAKWFRQIIRSAKAKKKNAEHTKTILPGGVDDFGNARINKIVCQLHPELFGKFDIGVLTHEQALPWLQEAAEYVPNGSDSTNDGGEETDGQKGQPEKKQNKSKNTRKLTIAARQCFKEFKKDQENDPNLTLKDHVQSWATTNKKRNETIYKACTANREELEKLFP